MGPETLISFTHTNLQHACFLRQWLLFLRVLERSRSRARTPWPLRACQRWQPLQRAQWVLDVRGDGGELALKAGICDAEHEADGCYGELPADAFEQILRRIPDPKEAVQALLALARQDKKEWSIMKQ